MIGALRHAEQRAHAELLHRLDVEDLDLDAEATKLRGAAGEFRRIQHVRRLVDEFPREQNAIHHVVGRRKRLARGGDIGHRDRDLRGELLVLVLFPGLVAVEFIGAQPDAGGDG